MIETLSAHLPAAISPTMALVLMLVSFVSSAVTASAGAGGGLIVLATLSNILPPSAVIPIHGIIQLGSNAGRTSMVFRHVDWRFIAWFFPGLLLGAAGGALLLVQIPPWIWQLTIAAFVLYLCWAPALPQLAYGRRGLFVMGATTTFLSLFVGASGPLVSAFIKSLHHFRFTVVATLAMAMTLQHLAKVLVFGFSGFNFQAWTIFIIAMISTGAIGTWTGLHILGKFSDMRFSLVFKLILSVLAARLIYQGFNTLVS